VRAAAVDGRLVSKRHERLGDLHRADVGLLDGTQLGLNFPCELVLVSDAAANHVLVGQRGLDQRFVLVVEFLELGAVKVDDRAVREGDDAVRATLLLLLLGRLDGCRDGEGGS